MRRPSKAEPSTTQRAVLRYLHWKDFLTSLARIWAGLVDRLPRLPHRDEVRPLR
jgi:hypothetical protein